MSAVAEQKTSEPSMEEILASIRRIISDDQQPVVKEAVSAPVPTQVVPSLVLPGPVNQILKQSEVVSQPVDLAHEIEEDVLELTAATPVTATIEQPELKTAYAEPVAKIEPAQYFNTPASFNTEPSKQSEPLIAGKTDTLVSNSFNNLSHTILNQNARTLDDVVKDMLHPMLKSWLDSNLPTIVERLVRAEIERVARGGR